MIQRAEVEVTSENRWFLERYLNVFDFVHLFPDDALSRDTARGIPVILKTDQAFDIVSDIDAGKMQLRNRSKFDGWMRWTKESGLNEGDKIIIEHQGDREYNLWLERSTK